MATAQRTSTYTCSRDGCERERTPEKEVGGSFCSEQCFYKHKGAKRLKNIKHDHRWCHGCFRRQKEIEKPGESYSVVIGPVDHDAVDPTCRDVLIGYQYLTEHARRGEREVHGVVDVDADAPAQETGPAPADTLVMTGTICECGTTDHRDDYLRKETVVSVQEATKRLCRALLWTMDEGQADKSLDIRTVARSLKETHRESGEWDWELAVGRAIQN